MHRPNFLILLISAILFGCSPHPETTVIEKNVHRNAGKKDDYSVRIKIPNEWIAKLNRFDYTLNNKILLQDFERYIKPDTLVNIVPEHIDDYNYGRILNPLFVNLDNEPGEELICLLGWDKTAPSLCVFKKIKGSWYLLYLEDIDTFYNVPTLSVTGNYAPNKIFYLRRVYNHGSGLYEDGYSFYKLINNKVYKCLTLVNDARIYGWGLFLNQSVKMTFEFTGDTGDEVGVNYDYNFFPGAIKEGDCHWCANEDIPLIKGSGSISYKWDNKSYIYKLDIPSYQNQIDDLTEKKIACFGAFGNDSLFVAAFADQIKEKIKTGSPQQKSILKAYLTKVRKGKVAAITY